MPTRLNECAILNVARYSVRHKIIGQYPPSAGNGLLQSGHERHRLIRTETVLSNSAETLKFRLRDLIVEDCCLPDMNQIDFCGVLRDAWADFAEELKFGFNDKLSARHTLIAMNAIHPERIAEISRWSPTGAPPVKKAWCHAS